MAQDPYRYFRVEARELTEQLSRNALELEKDGPPAGIVARLLRVAHTLKGAARVVKQREIADAAHAVEDALEPYRDGTAVPRAAVDTLLKLIDRISTLTNALSAPQESALAAAASPGQAKPAQQPRPPQEEALRTVRADVGEMDALLDGLAEIHAQLGTIRQAARTLDRARQVAGLLQDQVAAPRRGAGPLPGAGATLARIAATAEELNDLIGGLERKLAGGLEQIDREVRQTRDAAERLRLLPAGAVFSSLERTARDAAQMLDKRVAVSSSGSEVRLDANVLGLVQGALVQLVRNAVAHGIETEAQRTGAGKPAEGRIRIEVSRRGERATFSCRDDGRGLNAEAIRLAAQRRGLIGNDVQQLASAELFGLLLKGGISTSSTVTEVSGRGVGLDVVRETIERLGGVVRAESEPGKGTLVELTVPVSLSSLDALLVEAAGVRAAIPLEFVQRALRIEARDLATTPAGETVLHEGNAVPFLDLGRYLPGGDPDAQPALVRSAVVMESAGQLTAVGVDRLLGTDNIVLRALPRLAPADPIIAGASLDAEGNPQIVLDAAGLGAAARRGRRQAQAPALRRLPVLVIDDSPTTRMLEQSILEAAGYEAHVAVSAEEALEKARARTYGLFLVDVEMPGMDGFTFVEVTRADPVLRSVPAILVTSLDSPEHRRRGEKAGAYGYIVKSEFDQSDLLERIRKVIG
jgi:two-component system chemotaxis sensor kinase CheA